MATLRAFAGLAQIEGAELELVSWGASQRRAGLWRLQDQRLLEPPIAGLLEAMDIGRNSGHGSASVDCRPAIFLLGCAKSLSSSTTCKFWCARRGPSPVCETAMNVFRTRRDHRPRFPRSGACSVRSGGDWCSVRRRKACAFITRRRPSLQRSRSKFDCMTCRATDSFISRSLVVVLGSS